MRGAPSGDDLRGSRALSQRLNRGGANGLLRSLLIDLHLYARPGEDLVRFMWMWFANGRASVLEGRQRQTAAATALEEALREHVAPLLQDLMMALVRDGPEDVAPFAAAFLHERLSAGANLRAATMVHCKGSKLASHLSFRRGVFESSSEFPGSLDEFALLFHSLLHAENLEDRDDEDEEKEEEEKSDSVEVLLDHVANGAPEVSLVAYKPVNQDPFLVMGDASAHVCSWQPLAKAQEGSKAEANDRAENVEKAPSEIRWTTVPVGLAAGRRRDIESVIPKLFVNAIRVELDVLANGYSSAFVFKCRSWCEDGREEEQSVVKIDDTDKLQVEVERMEMGAPYLGESAPTVLAYTRCGATAGVRIQLCGACWTLPRFIKENSTLILTLKSLFKMEFRSVGLGAQTYPTHASMMKMLRPAPGTHQQEARPRPVLEAQASTLRRPASGRQFVTDFEDLLSMVFGEVMAKCYEDTKRVKDVDLVDLYGLEKKVQRCVLNQLDALRALPLERLQLGRELSTAEGIARFFADFLCKVDGRDAVHVALQHNDLNGNNVLVDAMGMAWVIDFADFQESHIVRDLAKLETCLMFEYTPLPDDGAVARALQFWRARLPLQGLEPLFVAVGRLRQFVADLTGTAGGPSQHAFALLAYSLDVLRYPDVGAASKLWALQACILHAQQILAARPPMPDALTAELHSASGLDLEAVETRYVAGCRLKHAYYTDAVTCERLPVSPRLALAFNAEICAPEDAVSERLDTDFARVFLLQEDVEDASLCGRLAVFGNSGMGKTLLLSLLVTRVAALTNLVPYVVNAVELAQCCERLGPEGDADLLDVFWGAKYGTRALRTAMLQRTRAQGRLVVICDGLSQAAEGWSPLLRRLVALSRPLLEETESDARGSTYGAAEGDDGDNEGDDDQDAAPSVSVTSSDARKFGKGAVRLVIATRPLNGLIEQAVQRAGFMSCTLQSLEQQHVLAFAETYLHGKVPAQVAAGLVRNYQLCQDALQVSLLLTSLLETDGVGDVRREMEAKVAAPTMAEHSSVVGVDGGASMERLFAALIDHNLAPLRLTGMEQALMKRVLAQVSFEVQMRGEAGSFFTMRSLLEAMTSVLVFEESRCWSRESKEGGGGRVVETSAVARGLNSLVESVHVDSHPLLRCRERGQRVLAREYAFQSLNAQAYLAALHTVATCTGREDLQGVMRALLRQPNSVGQYTAKQLAGVMGRVKHWLVSDRVRDDVAALDAEVHRCVEDALVRGGEARSTRDVESLVAGLLERVKNPRNRANLQRVAPLCARLGVSEALSVVESNLSYLAFLVEMLPADLRKVLVLEVLTRDMREELLCVAAGSAQFGSTVVPILLGKDLGISASAQSPRDGWSALMRCAASGKDPGVLRALFSHGAEANFACTQDQNRTALLEACRSGTADMVRALVDEGGAAVECASRSGMSPLLAACRARRADVVRFLVDHGARLDATTVSGLSAGYFAAKHGAVEVVAELAAAEVAAGRYADVRSYLCEHRVRICLGSQREDLTLLGAAIKWGRPSVTRWLLAQGVDPDVPITMSKQEILPVWLAAKMNGAQAVRHLVEAGCRLDVADARLGCTPFLVACLNGRSRIAAYLLGLPADRGVDLATRSLHGETCLELALKRPFVNVTRVLVDDDAACRTLIRGGDSDSAGSEGDGDALASAMVNLSQSPLQGGKALTVLRLLFESRVLGPRVRDLASSTLETSARNFAAHGNAPALEFLTTRVPRLCEDARLVSAMLPPVVRARHLGLARRLLGSLPSEGVDASAVALRELLESDNVGVDDQSDDEDDSLVDVEKQRSLELDAAIERFLEAHSAASPFVLEGQDESSWGEATLGDLAPTKKKTAPRRMKKKISIKKKTMMAKK